MFLLYLPTLSHASRQNLTKSLCNVNKRVKLISCFKLEYRYRLSVSANIGPKISVIGISVNFHIGASLIIMMMVMMTMTTIMTIMVIFTFQR